MGESPDENFILVWKEEQDISGEVGQRGDLPTTELGISNECVWRIASGLVQFWSEWW